MPREKKTMISTWKKVQKVNLKKKPETDEYQNQWKKCLLLTIRILKYNFIKILKYTLRHLIMILVALPFKDPFWEWLI